MNNNDNNTNENEMVELKDNWYNQNDLKIIHVESKSQTSQSSYTLTTSSQNNIFIDENNNDDINNIDQYSNNERNANLFIYPQQIAIVFSVASIK